MAILPETVLAMLTKETVGIDWQQMFPAMQLGDRRDPRAAAHKIEADVETLRSCSAVGKLNIRKERCARAGFTIEGEPCFYFGKTRVK